MVAQRTTGGVGKSGAFSSPDRLAATLSLDEAVDHVRLVSPARSRALDGLGIKSVRDLIVHYPRRYVDLSSKKTISGASIGSQCTIEGVVHEVSLKKPKPRLTLVEISLVDNTGILMVTAFRQPWLKDQIKAGMRLAVAGKMEFNYGFKRITNPYIEILEDDTPAEGRIIPVHPACEQISAKMMRRLIENALEMCFGLYDPLPLELRAKYRLMSRGAAFRAIHFPRSLDEATQARRRLAYEEVLLLELMLMQGAEARSFGKLPCCHVLSGPKMHAFENSLTFVLTDEQLKAREVILGELAAPHVANHMILGDVGTGKTIVAAFALVAAADSGSQAFLLAPTEVLACQHAKSLGGLFDEAGVRWGLLSGSTTACERTRLLEGLSSGTIEVLIGTHALLEPDVMPRALSLVVIDEQQRFGVEQRAALLAKGTAPDLLLMTATPIPRTLALALFGDLSLSYLTKRPLSAPPRKTLVHHKTDRGQAYDAAREALVRGEQVYVVCPLIGQTGEERDDKAASKGAGGRRREIDEETGEYAAISIESDIDLNNDDVSAAVQEAAYLQSNIFADWQVGLLHGRMSSSEKQSVMQSFRDGVVQVLVATTVIEVGIDVANATIMIVEDADRFGLSQLHQLRGRVGRGNKAAQVHLISASKSDTALMRLRAMESTDDGFELAQFDLSLRREGDILGNRQHGASSLSLVNVVRDGKIIAAAHADATAIIQEDPLLEESRHRALAREMRRMFFVDKTG